MTNQPINQTSFRPPSGPTAAAPSAPLRPAEMVPGLMPGHGLVRVNIQGSVMTSSMLAPSLMIDGRLLTSKYGVNAFQVPAGPHRVELYAQWMRRYGQASMDVQVPQGGAVDVFYAAPMHQFTTGNIGLTKQRRKGVLFMTVFLGIIFAMMFAGIWFAITLG